MHASEITARRELSIVHRTRVLESSRSRRYADSEEEEEPPALMIYEILQSVLRKQTRKPMQLLKQFQLFSEEESSIEVGYRHPRFELEIIEENIRAACTLIRQRLLVDGFITIKTLFLRKVRIEQTYYNHDNLLFLSSSLASFQTFYLKWEGFGRLYEHFRGNRLLKLNLSKIEAISNDCTSKELEDFHPFLNSERRAEVETVNSYLIDPSVEHDSADLHSPHERQARRNQEEMIKEHEEEYLEEHNHNRSRQSEEEYLEEHNYNRSLRKSRTDYPLNSPHLDQQLLVTHRKEPERHEPGSTIRGREQGAGEGEGGAQEIYLIRDYRTKGRSGSPSNFIKVPVLNENIKIVEILTGRKKTHKKRHSRQDIEIQQEICENCKFCVQMRERRETLRVVEQRIETVRIQTETTRTQAANTRTQAATTRMQAATTRMQTDSLFQADSHFQSETTRTQTVHTALAH